MSPIAAISKDLAAFLRLSTATYGLIYAEGVRVPSLGSDTKYTLDNLP